jgi:hypothetical protein
MEQALARSRGTAPSSDRLRRGERLDLGRHPDDPLGRGPPRGRVRGEHQRASTIDIISREIDIIGNLVGPATTWWADGAGRAGEGHAAHREVRPGPVQDAIEDLSAGRVRGRAIVIP